MMRRRLTNVGLAALASVMLIPPAAWAQTGSIAGVVKDTTGAVLPGVTVEAASPALIEKVRTVVTDNEGQYKIVDLRPGTYSVTFTLAGFSAVKREGIELTTAFTASVNAELRVGSLEETITVSGQAPLVDTQNVIQQKVLSRVVLDSLPTSKSYSSFANLIPGLQTGLAPDVGGTSGETYATMAIHGGRAISTSSMTAWGPTTSMARAAVAASRSTRTPDPFRKSPY